MSATMKDHVLDQIHALAEMDILDLTAVHLSVDINNPRGKSLPVLMEAFVYQETNVSVLRPNHSYITVTLRLPEE